MLISKLVYRRLGEHDEVFWQIVRFGIAGLALTVLVSLLYHLQVTFSLASPAVALTVATLIASVIGYVVHDRFSFRAHGGRDNPARRLVYFMVNNGIGYLLNLAFVYVLIDLMHLAKWTPMIGFCLVTPAVSFVINRMWVFR